MSVEKWLPYIDIQTVDTLTDEAEQNKVFVKITYSTTLDPETLNWEEGGEANRGSFGEIDARDHSIEEYIDILNESKG